MDFTILTRCIRLMPVTLAWFLAVAELPAKAAGFERSRDGEQFFERKVRPVLVEHCYECHGADKQNGGLRLDSLDALLAGGESGPVVVPGRPEESLLIGAVSWSDDSLHMPPKNRLPDAVVADLRAWIQMGAPWPIAQHASASNEMRELIAQVSDKDRSYWAFQPIRYPRVPQLNGPDWPENAIDALVLESLEEHEISPNVPATKRELIRRAFFDLIGLPPAPEEVESFERDESQAAFQRVIDSLLARPEYGERWARHWLDVVRYAQTNGYERDGEKPNAWRYRDYVIKAFNEDKPYDRFVLEQLAGDELDPVTDDCIIATGFYRLGVWDDEPDDARMAEFEELDDVMITTGATFLGLTIACARCHEHKFDPIPQEDYYKLLSFFRNIRPYANPKPTHDSATFVPLGDRCRAAKRLEDAKERSRPLREELAKTEDAKEKKRLQDEIVKIEGEVTSGLEWALAVRDGECKPTHVLVRGNAATPAAEVQPAFLSVLGGQPPAIEPPAHGCSSGRRLALARWIASPDHPLTARVMANRIWQHHFGRGIVKSTSDFGHSGVAPTHPKLLDWLAAELISGGWSIKHLHRVIMLSKTYQMSSRVPDTVRFKDPANDLLWRQNLRRLEAEAIRDSILAVSGQLNDAGGGRGFFPYTAGEVLAAGSRPGDGWDTSSPPERARRSIYAFVKRSMMPPFFEGFDYTNTAAPLGERPVTTVAPQALMLLNDQFMHEQSSALAKRIERETGDEPAGQIERAYALTLGRRPAPEELRVASRYLERQARSYAALASRLTFAANVPNALHRGFMNRLQPADFLVGPRDGWTYYRGRWGRDYEGITTLDRNCAPFALWQGPPFADAVINTEITLQKGVESAAILLRTTPDGDAFQGYDMVFDPREQSVSLRRHTKDVAVLAHVPCAIPTGQTIGVRIELAGARTRLWLDFAQKHAPQRSLTAARLTEPSAVELPWGDAILDMTDPEPIVNPGRLGVTAWGAAISLDHPVAEIANERHEVTGTGMAATSGTPRTRALESLCLLLFNLNEFIYVD